MLSYYYAPHYSGSAIQARNLSHHLQTRGVELFVVSANLTGSAECEVVEGIPVYRLPVVKTPSLQVLSFMLRLAMFLIRRRNTYDVIHAHGTLQHTIASLVARLLGKGALLKVAMAHSDIDFKGQGRLWGRANRYLVSRFDRYIATSRIIQEEFRQHSFANGRVHLMPNGVDTDTFRPCATRAEKSQLRASLGLPDRLTVCFVGIIISRKNVDLAVRAFREVRRAQIDAQLVLVGPLPERSDAGAWRYYEELLQYVEREGLKDSVIFTGLQPTAANYLRASDVFLFPSKQEGMPNALLEAMSSGLPSVASKISGTEDLIEQGSNGFMFALEDEPAFARTLIELLRNPELSQCVGEQARRFVEKSYSLRALSARYEQIYRDLTDAHA
jgi:glycosyltransferase involved in cell wall biosynthesis